MQAQHIFAAVALVLTLAALRDRRSTGGGPLTPRQRAWFLTATILGGVAAWLALYQ